MPMQGFVILVKIYGVRIMDNDERRFQALDFLFDYSKGTLWRVKDRVWKEVIPNFVVKRKEHPGLSIGRKRVSSIYDTIPMLIGTSKKSGRSFIVKNFYNNSESKDKVTHFNVLRPYSIRFNEFGVAKGVSVNTEKPRLTPEGVRQLNLFLGISEK